LLVPANSVVSAHVETLLEITLQRFQSVLLLSVEIRLNFRYIVVSEIERTVFSAAVKCSIVDETDHDARGQLAGEQLLLTAIEIIFWHLKTLANDAFYGIFGGSSFETACERNTDDDSFTLRTNSAACVTTILASAAPIRQKLSLLLISLIFIFTWFSTYFS